MNIRMNSEDSHSLRESDKRVVKQEGGESADYVCHVLGLARDVASELSTGFPSYHLHTYPDLETRSVL